MTFGEAGKHRHLGSPSRLSRNLRAVYARGVSLRLGSEGPKFPATGQDELGLSRNQARCMTTILVSVISWTAYFGPSLPNPLSFRPPYGIRSARHWVPQFM